MDRRYAGRLAASGLQKIKVSLHGSTPATHEHFTRLADSFQKTINAIKVSKEAGIEVWVNVVVTPRNFPELQKLPSVLGPYHVHLVQLSSITAAGRGERAGSYIFPERDLGNVINRLENHLSALSHSFTVSLFPTPQKPPFTGRFCDYFSDRLVVDHRGDIIPCCLLPKRLRPRLGNINEGLSTVYAPSRIQKSVVFSWLDRSHEAMRRELGYNSISHNLCSTCVRMLDELLRKDSETG